MRLSKLFMAAVLLLSMGVIDTDRSAPAADGQNTVADIRPLEVRMRRLHRVRPDLMHYPIQYDIIC